PTPALRTLRAKSLQISSASCPSKSVLPSSPRRTPARPHPLPQSRCRSGPSTLAPELSLALPPSRSSVDPAPRSNTPLHSIPYPARTVAHPPQFPRSLPTVSFRLCRPVGFLFPEVLLPRTFAALSTR